MTYHIPSDKQIQTALRKVFRQFRTVQSQHRLKKLVTNELNAKKKTFGVSERRLRNIALERVKNLTIWGGEVTIEFRCSNCNYWTGKKKRIPTRYAFYLKKK